MSSLFAENRAMLFDCPRLVELTHPLNPFHDDHVRIHALACGENIKKFSALNLLQEAQAEGQLAGVHTLVENSSGNMAMALAMLAPSFGIQNVIAILRADIPSGKLDPLRLARVQCRFTSELADEPGGIEMARQIGKKPGHLNLAQYENEANPRAFEKWIGPPIWRQTNGKVSLVCCGLGSTGTAMGLKRYFLRVAPQCAVIGVMLAPGHAVPGVRTEARLAEVGFPWRQTLDAIVQAETRESFKRSRDLWWKMELMVGPSSGFALAGLLHFLTAQKEAGTLDRYRNRDGEVRAVFLCPDLAYPYFDKYSTHLDPQDLA